ncbi:VCBS repeat-containing protein, partial [Streptomyces sp. NPDC045431]|uniref:FG-GAP repeat domain-containing protein n=1 Tax=Streptomyces sp. NPDC045431 TaxID=3155613 RepID=UPI0033DABD34
EGKLADPLWILDDFGVDQGWSSVKEHPRHLVRTTAGGAVDIVGFGPQGVVVARGRGDGTFEPSELVLNDFGLAQGWTSKKHLRYLADVTGDGNPDIVGFGDEGVWVSHNCGDGRFGQAQLVCRGFGYDDDAGAWRVGHHPRFVADITGDGRVDIVGFGGPGVYVARNLFRRFRTR